MNTLLISGLVKSYGKTAVVNGLDLSLAPGEFLSLLGPSGCGKTTTLRIVAGFVEPTAGTIKVNDRVLSSDRGSVPPEHRGMSMIFQSYAIWPNMTVFENVAFGLRAKRVPGDEIRRRVGEMLEVVRLDKLAGRYPGEMSGGQQQRVALARAIVVQPNVLLLDEPLSNLDANLREEMRTEIRRLHDLFGTTSIYVTHDQSEAMAISDRIAVMNDGQIEQIADPVTLYTKPKTRFVAGFVGRTNLIEGKRDGMLFDFDGFRIPVTQSSPAKLHCLFSLRPQTIQIRKLRNGVQTEDVPTDDVIADRVLVRGQVRQRFFLGEVWDYVVETGSSGAALRVAGPPESDFAEGSPVELIIDPSHLIPVD